MGWWDWTENHFGFAWSSRIAKRNGSFWKKRSGKKIAFLLFFDVFCFFCLCCCCSFWSGCWQMTATFAEFGNLLIPLKQFKFWWKWPLDFIMARSELRMISGSIARKTEMSKYYLVIKSLGNFFSSIGIRN